METHRNLPDTLGELLALERQVEREWWWLNGALHAVAQVQAEAAVGNLKCFREMQAQARTTRSAPRRNRASHRRARGRGERSSPWRRLPAGVPGTTSA